jgi:HK97 family phage major capsid protein
MKAETLDLIRACSTSPLAMMEDRWDALATAIAAGNDSPEAVRSALGIRGRDQLIGESTVVVIPISGMITPRSRYWGTSCEQLVLQVEAAVANPAVKAIVYDVDSPGGFVSGVPEAAERLLALRGEKPIIAVVNHLMASAAYWLGSTADKVVASPSSLTGSIGVFSAHIEFAKMLEDAGIKVTIIRAGRYKAEGSPFEPLTDTARGHMQETVDSYYGRFISGVAANRRTTAKAVARGYGEGRVLTADEAVAADLADNVGTLDEVLISLGVDPAALNAARSAAIAAQEQREREAAERRQEGKAERPALELRPAAAAAPPTEPIELIIPPGSVTAEMLESFEATERLAARREAVAPGAGTLVAAEDPEHEHDPKHDEDPDEEEDEEQPEAAGGAPAAEQDTPEPIAAPQAEEGETMSKDTVAPGGAATVTVGEDALAAERKRTNEIYELCADKVPVGMAQQFVAQGTTVENVKAFLAATGKPENAPVGTIGKPLIDMSEGDQRRYSVARALRAAADGSWGSAGFEAEIQAELATKLGRSPGQHSVLVPTALSPLPRNFRGVEEELARPRAGLTAAAATAGAELVFTEPGSFIDMLRNRMVLTRMGATFLPGLQGNVSFPKQTAAGTLSWRGENPGSDVALSDLVTGKVELTPKDATSRTSFSRRLLAQSAINVEQLVRRDLAAIVGLGLDYAGLHGTVSGDGPVGLYEATGVNSVAFGGPATWAKIVEMETAVVEDNADIGAMGYVTTPGIRGAAKTIEKATGTAQFLWTGGVEGGELNGFRALASNQVKKNLGTGQNEHGILFGCWEHLLVGEWGALELIVDPLTLAGQGMIVVTVYVIADIGIRYPEAFSKGTGLVLAAAAS